MVLKGLKRDWKAMEANIMPKKKKELCMTKGQLKTLIDEARGGDVCDAAADLIKDIDEEFKTPEKKKKSKKKKQKSFIERWF